jgi:hypothetical protein
LKFFVFSKARQNLRLKMQKLTFIHITTKRSQSQWNTQKRPSRLLCCGKSYPFAQNQQKSMMPPIIIFQKTADFFTLFGDYKALSVSSRRGIMTVKYP